MFGVSPLDYIQSLEFAIKEYHIPELPAISSDFNLRTILVENESHFASDDLKLGDPVHYSSQRTLSYSTIPVDDNSESDDVEFMEFAQRTELYDPYIPRSALFGDSRTKRQRQSSDLSIIEDNDDDENMVNTDRSTLPGLVSKLSRLMQHYREIDAPIENSMIGKKVPLGRVRTVNSYT
tara:strand:+ start:368 stop:904 length:537 start_codon:yes stop_codon:yes gene_type:complete